MDFQNIRKTPKTLDFRGLLFFCDIRLNYRLHNDNRRNVLSMIKHAIHAVEIMMEIN